MFSSNIASPFIKVIICALIIWVALIASYYIYVYRVFSQRLPQLSQPVTVITKPVPQYAPVWKHALAANPIQIKRQLLRLLSDRQLVRFHFGVIEEQHLQVTIIIDESFYQALNFLIRLIQLPFIFDLEKLDWTNQRMVLQLNFLME